VLKPFFEALKGLPPNKIAMGFGVFLCFGAYQLENEERILVFIAGLVLFVIGVVMAVIRAKADQHVRDLDMELREKKLEKGLDPELDKTIYKVD